MVRARCRKLAVESVDLAFQPRDLGVGHFEPTARVLGLVREAEIGAEIEQIVLNAREHGVEDGMTLSGMEARNADRRVGLVERAIGLDPEVVFRHAPPGAERGRAVVAGARIDLREDNHRPPALGHDPEKLQTFRTRSCVRDKKSCPTLPKGSAKC